MSLNEKESMYDKFRNMIRHEFKDELIKECECSGSDSFLVVDNIKSTFKSMIDDEFKLYIKALIYNEMNKMDNEERNTTRSYYTLDNKHGIIVQNKNIDNFSDFLYYIEAAKEEKENITFRNCIINLEKSFYDRQVHTIDFDYMITFSKCDIKYLELIRSELFMIEFIDNTNLNHIYLRQSVFSININGIIKKNPLNKRSKPMIMLSQCDIQTILYKNDNSIPPLYIHQCNINDYDISDDFPNNIHIFNSEIWNDLDITRFHNLKISGHGNYYNKEIHGGLCFSNSFLLNSLYDKSDKSIFYKTSLSEISYSRYIKDESHDSIILNINDILINIEKESLYKLCMNSMDGYDNIRFAKDSIDDDCNIIHTKDSHDIRYDVDLYNKKDEKEV